jgi:hypothetical protein
VLVGIVGLLVSGWWLTQTAESQQAAVATAPIKWEYNTVNIEANTLEAKLGELSNAGWEVFSLDHTETALVQQAADNQTKLQVQKFQVTSKRRMK